MKIKEYLVAVEVYRKPPSYDPTVDSLVRVEARRLHRKLQDYYAGDGSNDPVRIVYPKGRYAPAFSWQAVTTAIESPAAELSQKPEPPSPEPEITRPRTRPGWRYAAAAVTVAAAVVAAWQMFRPDAGAARAGRRRRSR